ncbi:MAG: Flp1 family type IVb pilin [Bacillota bacterium]|nr:Flp1 family type IVb pilin [Bacillota bacterium]
MGKSIGRKLHVRIKSKKGMELVQVAILVAIAVALGLIFKSQITDFVNRTFEGLSKFN